MPKPKNLYFKSTEPEIRDLFEKILSKIFKIEKKNTQADRAGQLVTLSYETNPNDENKLAPSELIKEFLRPYDKGGEIHLSQNYWDELCRVLLENRKQYDYLEETDVITRLKAFYQGKYKAAEGLEFLKDQIYNAWSRVYFLEGTQWNLFERVGGQDIKGSQWGISVGVLSFTDLADSTKVNLRFPPDYRNASYEGLVHCDKQENYLYMDMTSAGHIGQRATITMELVDSGTAQTLALGHCTYHYSSDRRRLLTRTGVMLKAQKHDDENPASGYRLLPPGYYVYGTEDYDTIETEVKNFLYSRDRNRMALPKLRVAELADMKEFFEEQQDFADIKLREEICGDYMIYRMDNEAKVMISDELRIYEHAGSREVRCVYMHSPDAMGVNKKKWAGRTFINKLGDCVILELAQERVHNLRQSEDPVLIMFNVPGDSQAIDSCDYFPGLISGIKNDNKGPAAMLIWLVKTGVKKDEADISTRMAEVLAKVKNHLIKPEDATFNFDVYSQNKTSSN